MKDKIKKIIKEIVSNFLEANDKGHFKQRIFDRLQSDFTNFTKEKKELQDVVRNGIEFLKKVRFPGQDNVGVLLLKGPSVYVYHNVIDGKVEHSEGRFVWVVIRANDLETIVFGDMNYVPKNTQIHLTIDRIKDYIINEKKSDFNLTEKDLVRLQTKIRSSVAAVEKPKENIVIINGTKWIVDEKNERIYKKNNPDVSYDVYGFMEKVDEKLQDEILSYLVK